MKGGWTDRGSLCVSDMGGGGGTYINTCITKGVYHCILVYVDVSRKSWMAKTTSSLLVGYLERERGQKKKFLSKYLNFKMLPIYKSLT